MRGQKREAIVFASQIFPQITSRFDIDSARRLIEYSEQRILSQQSHRYLQSSLLTARQLLNLLISRFANPHRVEGLLYLLWCIVFFHNQIHQLHLVVDSEFLEYNIFLEHYHHLLKVFLSKLLGRFPAKQHPSILRTQRPYNCFEKCSLSCTILGDQSNKRIRMLELERKIV